MSSLHDAARKLSNLDQRFVVVKQKLATQLSACQSVQQDLFHRSQQQDILASAELSGHVLHLHLSSGHVPANLPLEIVSLANFQFCPSWLLSQSCGSHNGVGKAAASNDILSCQLPSQKTS